MLEQLFGSKTRTQLLRTFLQNPETPFFVRELTRRIDVHINAVRHELVNLERLGLVSVVKDASAKATQKKHFQLNLSSILYPDLKALFLKSRVLLEKDLVDRLKRTGTVKYFALTGRFLGRGDMPTDMFVVGNIERRKFAALIKESELSFGHEINYTILDEHEMRYRMDVMDRFLYEILDAPKMVFVDAFFNTAKVSSPDKALA